MTGTTDAPRGGRGYDRVRGGEWRPIVPDMYMRFEGNKVRAFLDAADEMLLPEVDVHVMNGAAHLVTVDLDGEVADLPAVDLTGWFGWHSRFSIACLRDAVSSREDLIFRVARYKVFMH